jgi:hypothetical protein
MILFRKRAWAVHRLAARDVCCMRKLLGNPVDYQL